MTFSFAFGGMTWYTIIMSVWKTIPSCPKYEASSDGQIRSKRFLRSLKGSENSCGYLRVQIGSSSNKKFIHRLIAETFLPLVAGKSVVNHKNGLKHDNAAKNLEWVTQSENDLHKYRTGLGESIKGQSHHNAALDNEKVKAILSSSQSNAELAKKYSVSPRTIRDVRNRKTWKHILLPHDLHTFIHG